MGHELGDGIRANFLRRARYKSHLSVEIELDIALQIRPKNFCSHCLQILQCHRRRVAVVVVASTTDYRVGWVDSEEPGWIGGCSTSVVSHFEDLG